MGESKRQLKIARQLQKDLSDIFRRKFGDLFRNALLTITRIHVSPDLSVARIYVSILTKDDASEVMKKIAEHKHEVRKALGNKIGKQVRKIPELVFLEDQGSQHASEIEEILSKLDIPPQED